MGSGMPHIQPLTDFITGQIQGPDKEQMAWVNAKTYDMIFTQPVITEFKDFAIVPVKLIIGTTRQNRPRPQLEKRRVLTTSLVDTIS